MKYLIIFRYHPKQCLVGKSGIILDGWEHAEDEADEYGEEPDDNWDQDHVCEKGEGIFTKAYFSLCVSNVFTKAYFSLCVSRYF